MRINDAFNDSEEMNPVLEQAIDDAPPLDDVPGADDEEIEFDDEVQDVFDEAERPMWQKIGAGVLGAALVVGVIWGISPKMPTGYNQPAPPPPDTYGGFNEGEWL